MQRKSSIISAKEVLTLTTIPVVIIDARGGPDAYKRFLAGHIQGALFVDLETQLSHKSANAADGGRHPLPSASAFGVFLSTLGITPTTIVVVYDDKGGANAAARFWWMMKALGHQEVFVADGGFDALAKAGLKVVQDETSPTPANSVYPTTDWLLPTTSIHTVAEAAADPNRLVIDVREGYRYLGDSEPIDLVAGHIPGAVNVPYLKNLSAEGTFLDASSLAKMYRDIIGDRDPSDVIIHCGSGVTACHTLLALEKAGMHGASLYVGSWSEWSRNDRPMATGDRPE